VCQCACTQISCEPAKVQALWQNHTSRMRPLGTGDGGRVRVCAPARARSGPAQKEMQQELTSPQRVEYVECVH
jgi:hypothetical protein